MLLSSRRALAALATAALATTLTLPAGADAKTGKSHKKKPVSAKVIKRNKALLRKFATETSYDGPTGTIAHFTSRVVAKHVLDGPATSEQWVEFGGGNRYLRTDTFNDDKPAFTQISWGAPGWWAVWDVSDTAHPNDVVHVSHPGEAPTNVPLPALQRVPELQALAGQSPAGPVIGGHATVAVEVPLDNFPEFAHFAKDVVYLDAQTKAPLRFEARTGFAGEVPAVDSTEDISRWEILPAGTSTTVFTRKIPVDAVID